MASVHSATSKRQPKTNARPTRVARVLRGCCGLAWNGKLASGDYARASARATVDYVLLFLPNEQLTGFIHEHDPALLDDALGQRVVMCSPLTLFAFLGVIRQAFDNFMVEQTSDQILGLISKFGQQWLKYNEALDKVKNRFDQLRRSFDELVGPAVRQLEKPLQQLDAVRRNATADRRQAVPPSRRRNADDDLVTQSATSRTTCASGA